MKKILLVAIVLTVLFTACGKRGVIADVPDNPEGKDAQAVVEQYITAYKNNDDKSLISLYSNELVWMDYGFNDGPYGKSGISATVREGMSTKYYTVKIDSYVVTVDGRFAVLQGEYSQPNKTTNKWTSVPGFAVLEIKDAKIISESWYYNVSAFH
jgi:major membrane immunogen (membrane-anchored lipoprotein)